MMGNGERTTTKPTPTPTALTQLRVEIDEALHNKLKIWCDARGVKMKFAVAQAVQAFINQVDGD